MAALNALGRHLALIGFMGAGKTTIGREVARRLGRSLVDLDARVEEVAGQTIEEIFERDGEARVPAARDRALPRGARRSRSRP